MTETEYLKLKKPAQEDFYNVDDMNRNSDLIDAKLKTLASDLEATNTDLANKANKLAGTCSMWTLRRDNEYGTKPRDVTWYKIGKFCFVPAVFTATQTASRVRTIAGLPYPAKDYTCVPISYVPVSGTASLMGILDAGKTEITIQWLDDNAPNNDGKYYDIRANIIYRVED